MKSMRDLTECFVTFITRERPFINDWGFQYLRKLINLAVKIHKVNSEDEENKWQSSFKTLQNSVPTAKKR